MNNFKADLAFSHAAHRLPFWDEQFYPACFPDFCRRELREGDGSDQRDGVDCVLHLTKSTSGIHRQKLVDEKVRRQLFQDVLLEVWSDIDRRAPGWANPQKALRAEFIAYANVLTGAAFLFSVQQLHRAFTLHGERWLEENKASWRRDGLTVAYNRCWRTGNVPVKVDDLLRCLADVTLVRFAPRLDMHPRGAEAALDELRLQAECAADRAWRLEHPGEAFAPRPVDVERWTGVRL